MNGNIEELVLSGKLFNPPSRSSSPVRSRSPSPAPASRWPGEESDYDYDSDVERQKAIERTIGAESQQDSIGMGPGRTGVKGVIRDSKEAASIARNKRAEEIKALNKAMEKASLGGKTWAEEERERLEQKAREEGRPELLGQQSGNSKKGRFGHLREVSMRTFVQAVEGEERNTWVIVHIYDPSLDRCATLDDTLTRLARLYPSVKFLRGRAGALGFARSTSSSRNSTNLLNPRFRLSARQPFTLTRTPSRKILVPGRYPDEDYDDDEDENSEGSADEGNDGWDDDLVDTDVLPTLLVYRGGELVHSWVRVDWEAQMGVEELLRRHHILSDTFGSSNGNCGLPSDDDDDFDDGELVFSGSDDA
ncbi:hypothetical protein K474DRAFT_1680516 [Panus rudis PR-1116 ss-1]|nr:hypothetical protein K474DRAFT_1680516 [Panus rudis PR-1116 ss-1]